MVLAVAGTSCGRYLRAAAAVVDGKSISMAELDKRVGSALRGGEAPSGEQRLEAQRRELAQMIQDRIIEKEGRERKIKVDQKEVDARYEQIRSQFPSEQEFEQALSQQGVTLDSVRDRIRLRLVVETIQKTLAEQTKVSDREVREAYGKGASLEQARVRHILFRIEDPAKQTEVQRKAQSILNQLRAGGDFAALAKKHSQDPGSGQNGGDLGLISRGQTVPEFERIAFALKAGQISNLVRSQFGFHIIQTLEIKKPSLKEAAPELKKQLQQEKAQKAFGDFLAKRVRVASVRVNPRFGTFNPATLQIEPKQFFTPASPEPEPAVPGLGLPPVQQ